MLQKNTERQAYDDMTSLESNFPGEMSVMNRPKTGRTCSLDMTVPEKGLEVIQIGRGGGKEGPHEIKVCPSAHLTVTHFGGQSRARSVRVEETLLATRTRVKRSNRVRWEHANIS